MGREHFLTPEDMFPPPVTRLSQGDGHIGPVKDGHKVVRRCEDRDEVLEVIHPYHCCTRQGEGVLGADPRRLFISGGGEFYEIDHPLYIVDYATCAWRLNVQDWWDSYKSRGDLWIGNLYGDGASDKTIPTLEEALPLEVEVEVWWTCQWWYDSYTGEHDGAFSFWVER